MILVSLLNEKKQTVEEVKPKQEKGKRGANQNEGEIEQDKPFEELLRLNVFIEETIAHSDLEEEVNPEEEVALVDAGELNQDALLKSNV